MSDKLKIVIANEADKDYKANCISCDSELNPDDLIIIENEIYCQHCAKIINRKAKIAKIKDIISKRV